ncbi:MAG: amidohydrolase family protein [Geodermatophilaceae bacterium]|nr:amidohydrolase family protein [Geodermatophilaceae bacterium]
MTRTVYAGAQVVDGTGAAPTAADVAVEDGRFVEIGIGLDGDEQVDCTGKSLLPGLFDCHVHVMFSGIDVMRMMQTPFSYPFYEALHNLEATLAQGVTSVRDAGGADLGVQQAVRNGLIAGPRMQISLGMLSQTGGHGDDWMPCGAAIPLLMDHPGRPSTIVDGPDEMRRKVRELIRNGADVIKVATSGGVLSPRSDPRRGQFRDAEIAVLVEEATAAGRFVMAHAQATDGIKVAIRNGVRSIEHGIYLDDQAIDMMLAAGTWLVPTLAAPRAVIDLVDAGVALPTHMVDKARLVMEAHTDSMRRAVAAGVKVAMGTDSGVGAHGHNLRELGLMVDCGMTPTEALHATSLSAAQLLGVDAELGSIEVGKRADLVVVDGDPLDVSTLGDRIEGVYMDGRLVSSPAA